MRSESFCAVLTTVVCVFVAGSYALPTRTLAADQPASPRTLTLRGEGSASVAPDLAWLTLGVDTQATKARVALRENADAMTKVVAALKSEDLAGNDVQTSNVSLTPLYSNDPKQPRTITGYRADNLLTLRIHDLTRIGNIIDEATAVGSNEIESLRFGVDDPNVGENRARTAAVRNAVAKAKIYARAAGVELGPIMKIAEESPGTIRPLNRMLTMAPVGAAATPIEPGELTVHAVVNITWSIK